MYGKEREAIESRDDLDRVAQYAIEHGSAWRCRQSAAWERTSRNRLPENIIIIPSDYGIN